MKPTLSLLVAAALATGATGAMAQNIAKVNGVAIPTARADAMLRDLAAQGRGDSPQLRQAVKDELINREIMSQEAGKMGLAKLPEVAAQIDAARQTALAQRDDLTKLRTASPRFQRHLSAVKAGMTADRNARGQIDQIIVSGNRAPQQFLHAIALAYDDGPIGG